MHFIRSSDRNLHPPDTIRFNVNPDALLLIEDTSRETTAAFMKLNQYVDVLIPRGGAGLIRAVVENSTIPVIETGTGNCHIFVDATADFQWLWISSSTPRPRRVGVCNACESLLNPQRRKRETAPGSCCTLAGKTCGDPRRSGSL